MNHRTLHVGSGAVSAFHNALIEYANLNARPIRLVIRGEESGTEHVGAHAVVHRVKSLRKEILEIVRAERPALIEISDNRTLLRKNFVFGGQRPVLVTTGRDRRNGTSVLGRLLSRLFLSPDMHIVPIGVSAQAFTPVSRTPEARRALADRASAPACARLLLYVGRLTSESNVPMLVRMMDCLPPQYHLLLAGDGPLAPLLRAVGEQRRIKLVQQNDLAALYAGADAFVDGAPFGNGPLQAMAAGVPLVAANEGAVPSYVTPENAWLTQPTPDALADAITQLWRMPLEQVRARTAQARSTAEQHDWPIIAKRCFAQFDELIASKSCC